MRLLNRLKQYQRLWQPSAGEPQSVTVGELAERCFCSERHVRTLLRQAQESGWLTWEAQSGRGKRGKLQFLVTPESLRNTMMEQALEKGQQLNVLELAQLAPGELRTMLQPFMGGQWQNDTPTLRIPYYRPLDPLHPGFLPGRAEQHLAGQIFSGLTRFDNASQRPCGDLAHHWDISADGMRWDFYIRSTLHWHNGDTVETAQLHARLLMLLDLPALNKLFISVKRIEVTHPQCLTFILHRPDYWLAHRLASYCSHLAHPHQPLSGTGPFRLTLFTPELVRLESHDNYHLCHPLLKAIEYWITPQLFDQDLGTSCRHPVQIAIGNPEELASLSQVSSGISLGFCYLTLKKGSKLSLQQARRLVDIIHHTSLLQTLPVDENLITPSNTLLPGWVMPQWKGLESVELPKKLTLVYHLPVELHTMAEQLQQYLATLGCELTLIFHNAKNWDNCPSLAKADLMMGDRLIGEAPEYTLEQWLRCDQLWPHVLDAPAFAHLQATLDALQTQPGEDDRYTALQQVFTSLMNDATLTPLFNYHYRISAPPGVNGVQLNPRGWFEFEKAWLPPPRGEEAGRGHPQALP
ncbi:TPA: SgrR family transcriptional regulator [Citrobacter koseri]|nr:SgrR family transcriptional regulator [Citrobacter koseri]